MYSRDKFYVLLPVIGAIGIIVGVVRLLTTQISVIEVLIYFVLAIILVIAQLVLKRRFRGK